MERKNSSSSWPSDVEADLGGLPDTVERRCTDLPWLLVFFLCWLGWLFAMRWAVQCGDFNRLGAFMDGNGRRCNEDFSLKRERYLFFCRNASGGHRFDMARPICVPFCPNSSFTAYDECGGYRDYPTVDVFSMVCFPDVTQVWVDEAQAADLRAFTSAAETTVAARVVVERYGSLFACMALSILASYIEIYILEYNASCIVKFGMITLSFGCLIIAAYLLGCFKSLGVVPTPSPYLLPGGVTLAIIGSLFACILINLRDSVDAACDCIELACTCVMRTPMLTMLPLAVTMWNLVVTAISVGGAVLMISCGREELTGGVVSVRFDAAQCVFFALLVAMGLWMHQVVFALNEFTLAHTTAVWYFRGEGSSERLPKCAVWRALWQAHRYHFGTIVLGGAVVFLTRLLRLPISLLVSWTKMHNPVGRIFGVCCCGIDYVYTAIHPLSKNAFIDVAMNARPFCEASKCADAVLQHEVDTVRILNGATWVFQFVGVMSNAAFGACLMIWHSNYVIGDDSDVTLVMAVAGAAVSGYSAFPFALVFDTVSDTIFYCSEVEQMRNPPPPTRPAAGRRSAVARYCPCLYKAQVGKAKGNRRVNGTGGAYAPFDGESPDGMDETGPWQGVGHSTTTMAASPAAILRLKEAGASPREVRASRRGGICDDVDEDDEGDGYRRRGRRGVCDGDSEDEEESGYGYGGAALLREDLPSGPGSSPFLLTPSAGKGASSGLASKGGGKASGKLYGKGSSSDPLLGGKGISSGRR